MDHSGKDAEEEAEILSGGGLVRKDPQILIPLHVHDDLQTSILHTSLAHQSRKTKRQILHCSDCFPPAKMVFATTYPVLSHDRLEHPASRQDAVQRPQNIRRVDPAWTGVQGVKKCGSYMDECVGSNNGYMIHWLDCLDGGSHPTERHSKDIKLNLPTWACANEAPLTGDQGLYVTHTHTLHKTHLQWYGLLTYPSSTRQRNLERRMALI